MKRLLLLCCIFLLSLNASAQERPLRLVSLAPSLTEMIFAIGADENLIGVTNQCIFPPEALALPRVGDFIRPDPLAVDVLQPDLVLMLAEHLPDERFFDSMRTRYEILDNRTFDGILDALTRLGDITGKPYEAGRIRDELQASLLLPIGYDAATAPTMLLILSRDYGAGDIADVTVVGQDRLYDRLITSVGFRNAYDGNADYPTLTAEQIALLNPDVIVEGFYTTTGSASIHSAAVRDWLPIARLDAARANRIYSIRSDYVFVPGPRMVLMKRDLEDIVRRSEIVTDQALARTTVGSQL